MFAVSVVAVVFGSGGAGAAGALGAAGAPGAAGAGPPSSGGFGETARTRRSSSMALGEGGGVSLKCRKETVLSQQSSDGPQWSSIIW